MQPSTPPPYRPTPEKNAWGAFLVGFRYAFSGISHVIRTQRNMRVHIAIGLIAVLAGLLLGLSPLEFALLFVTMICVFTAEMFNTVFELCVDLASPQYHPLAKVAKDVAAGAVLVSAILAVLVGVCLFVPHLWTLLFSR
ncbi:diacylglycerol kinase family protein [Ktedonospora formicarum]|uniref:Diacylglycerol kinase n=1 Tax=Ktedonospora formicarum TaxID=2778364 RepID=A0A8J3HXZ2_9CHLR|nr:diacylglycerol kinase family protein [Ktedonospora formicarum]GHO43028.1 diacylglycerol kinase [Ktedonospora formicarum]